MGSTSFVELFVVEAFHEDLETISCLPMLINPKATFAMLSLCYAQRSCYLLHIMFSSLGILLHYAELDTCTIITLEKLLGVGSFNGSINHLAHCQAIFLSFLGRFGLLFLV
jgi:hypothetical protein